MHRLSFLHGGNVFNSFAASEVIYHKVQGYGLLGGEKLGLMQGFSGLELI